MDYYVNAKVELVQNWDLMKMLIDESEFLIKRFDRHDLSLVYENVGEPGLSMYKNSALNEIASVQKNRCFEPMGCIGRQLDILSKVSTTKIERMRVWSGFTSIQKLARKYIECLFELTGSVREWEQDLNQRILNIFRIPGKDRIELSMIQWSHVNFIRSLIESDLPDKVVFHKELAELVIERGHDIEDEIRKRV